MMQQAKPMLLAPTKRSQSKSQQYNSASDLAKPTGAGFLNYRPLLALCVYTSSILTLSTPDARNAMSAISARSRKPIGVDDGAHSIKLMAMLPVNN
jgi:hypothetical protein